MRKDAFMAPVYEHIRKDILRRHPNWKDELKEEKYILPMFNRAKKIVWESVRETKDPYMRDGHVEDIATEMVWRRGVFK